MIKPQIAFIDIETSPILGYTWSMYDANVLSVQEPIKVLSCAWKWSAEKRINVRALCDYDTYEPGVVDDKALVSEVWSILDSADVVVAHNGDSFDVKILNARFIANGLLAPSDYKTVDTLKAAKKYFKFISNSLDNLGSYLDEGHKVPSGGFDTWLGCMKGDPVAWEKMKKYNAQDIVLLERVYLRLRPFIGNHPNLNAISMPKAKAEFICQSCQSPDTIRRGKSITKRGWYQRYQCNSCGSWGSGLYERLKVNKNA